MVDFNKMLSKELQEQLVQREDAKVKVRELMASRGGRLLTHEEKQELRGNSFFREEILPFLDNEALAKHAEYCLSQTGANMTSSVKPAVTYEDVILSRIVPEMVRRLKMD